MPSNNDFNEHLRQAGERAAVRPGPTAPPLDSIRVEVAKRQRRQAMLTGIAAAVVIIALVPVAAFFLSRGTDDSAVVAVASETAVAEATSTTEAEAAPVEAEPSVGLSETPPVVVAQDVDSDRREVALEENVDVQISVGDRSYSLAVSYTHSPSPRDRQKSRMPSSA